MGYYASGSGDATFKEGVTKEIVEKAIKDFYESEEGNKFYCLDYDTDVESIEIWDDEKYHEEDTIEFLKVLAPYIKEGHISYTGEDDCIWRFVFNPETGKWDEEYATVSFGFEEYEDDELIEELEKRGYVVSKK